MPITYPIDFPQLATVGSGMSSFSCGLRVAAVRTESPFSFVEQVVKWSGEIWDIEIALPNMRRDDAEEFNAFLLKLRGKYGTFLVGDPNASAPRGLWGGTPLVNGAGQTGDELLLDGLPTSQAKTAKAGDYIQIGTGEAARLYKILEDADSNSSGEMTILIAPNLRTSPADNEPIIYQNARGVFRLTQNIVPFRINSESIYSISFKATESLGIGPINSGSNLADPDGNTLADPDGNNMAEPE